VTGGSVIGSRCSLDLQVRLGLVAQPDEQRLRAITQDAGLRRFRPATGTPLNVVLQARP
jgi:hypothetical protein